MLDIIVIGSGPAGATAAIYAARAMRKIIMITGSSVGGQLTKTTLVENFPGFPSGIMGPELMENMHKQLVACSGADAIVDDEIINITKDKNGYFLCQGRLDTYQSRTVILATGANAKYLGVKGEEEYAGFGVSACATCDGMFFRNLKVAVVGGGNTAAEEALYLTKYASEVTVIHRRSTMRAEALLKHKLEANNKVKFIWNSVVEEICGEESERGIKKVTGIKIKSTIDGSINYHGLDGVFVAIGHSPATKNFSALIETDADGYAITKPSSYVSSNCAGLFIAGDIADKIYRQAIVAAGFGCIASIEAEHYLTSLDN